MLYGMRGSINVAKDSVRLWRRSILVGRQTENNVNGKLEIDVAIRRGGVGRIWVVNANKTVLPSRRNSDPRRALLNIGQRKSMLSFLVIRELRKEKVKERTVPNCTAHTPVIHWTVLGRTLRSA